MMLRGTIRYCCMDCKWLSLDTLPVLIFLTHSNYYKYMVFTRRVLGNLLPFYFRLLLIMKLAIFLTLGFALHAYADANSQTITLDLKNKPLQKVMREMHKQQGYSFLFHGKNISDIRVDANFNKVEFTDAMNEIMDKHGLSWSLEDGIVTITSRPSAPPESTSSLQQRTITGKVTDEEGNPLAGVTVSVDDLTQSSTRTDNNGRFILDVPKGTHLSIRFIGYESQTILLAGKDYFEITLIPNQTSLDEVVVVGFGTQKKESVVGAISTISPKNLQVGTSRSISNNLIGQLSGVIGSQRSGEPGFDGATFFIRGVSSFNGSNSPLVLVDGIERSLDNIDPAEIESFSILKDAAASAVYGVRGANGVILINTKRGKIGRPIVDVRYEQGMTFLGKLPSYIDSYNYASLVNAIAKEEGNAIPYSEDDLEKYRTGSDRDLYPNVNWIDEITKDYGSNSRFNVDVSGGSEILRYSLIASVYNMHGIMETDKNAEWDNSDKLNRYSLRSNVDVNITPTTLLRVNIGGYLQDHRTTSGKRPDASGGYASVDEIFREAFNTSPIVHPVAYSTGEIPLVVNRANPWAWLTQTGYQTTKASSIESLFSLEQDLGMVTDGLKVKGLFSFDRFSSGGVRRDKGPTYYSPATSRNPDGSLVLSKIQTGNDFLGYSMWGDYGTNSMYSELSLSYANYFGNHYLEGMLMYNMRDLNTGGKQPFRYMGTAGRLSYTYDRRYIGEVNFGYNGSENFAKGHRYGFFPSVALGWIMSEEAFMEPLKQTFDMIKFRGSYGLVGNDIIGTGRGDVRFPYLTTIDEAGGYSFGMNNNVYYSGLREGLAGSNNLTWEKVRKANAGFELGIANSIDLIVDYFMDKRYDIFMQRVNIPSSTGFTRNPYANFGKTTNSGVEMSLNIQKQVSPDFEFIFRATMTYAKSKITEIDEPLSVIGTNRARTGNPIGQLYGYIAEGLFTDEDFEDAARSVLKEGIPKQHFSNTIRPGDIKYRDLNDDGIITALDMAPIGGTWDPTFIYGFGQSMRYKSVDFSFFLQGNQNTYRIIGQGHKTFIPGTGAGVGQGNVYSNFNDRWSVESPKQDVFWPRLSSTINENNVQPSTWWLRNMSVLRIKNIELGYNFSRERTLPNFFTSARVFVTCTNPIEFSTFKLWDPELDTSTGSKYPLPRVVSFGVNASF